MINFRLDLISTSLVSSPLQN